MIYLDNRIRIRDDDVLTDSSAFSNSFLRFKQVHGWICESKQFIHVPTILVEEIQQFPECIDYIRDETKEGRMLPEIHGHAHVDFDKMSKVDLIEKFKLCKEFLWEKFEVQARIVYSPWGANAPHIREATEECGLKLVDCSDTKTLAGKDGVVQALKHGRDLSFMYGKEIHVHWWERGRRLERVIAVAKYGSWKEAAAADPELFK